jgi:hypothetical protein
MDNRVWLELVGYLASVLIAVSLMMSSILRLRLINLIGAAMFAGYGLLIRAYPVAILNGLIVLVNAWHLLRMLRAKEFFQVLPLKPESVYLPYFLEFYGAEIRRILPDFKYQPSTDQLALFVLRDCAPVGVFIAERKADGVLNVMLDFVIPGYRDLKLGRFLFSEQADFFRQQGVKEIVIAPRTKEFGAYLVKVGFEPTGQEAGAFRIGYAGKRE